MNYETLIGLRYTRARNRASGRNHFISFIALMSMAGIALGVAALIVVLSVMNGFQKELRARILGVAAHVQITGPDNRLSGWTTVVEAARKHPQVEAAAPFVNAQAMLSADSLVRGSVVRGIVPAEEARVAEFDKNMVLGKLDALKPGEFNTYKVLSFLVSKNNST